MLLAVYLQVFWTSFIERIKNIQKSKHKTWMFCIATFLEKESWIFGQVLTETKIKDREKVHWQNKTALFSIYLETPGELTIDSCNFYLFAMNSFAIIYQKSCVFLIIFETATTIKFQRGFLKVEENLTKPSLKSYWWQSRKPHCFRAAKIKKPHLINNFKKCISPKLIQKIITIFSTNPFIYN